MHDIDLINLTNSGAGILTSSSNANLDSINFDMISKNSRGIYLYNSNAFINNSYITSSNSLLSDFGIRCYNSDCYIKNSNIDSNDVSLRSNNGFLQINDSITGSRIEVANNGIIELYNVTDNGIYISDSGSSILRFWNLTVINPNNSSFIIRDIQNNLVVNLTQNFTSFYIAQFNHTNNISIQLTPHGITANKIGFFTSQSDVTMNQDRIITLSLLEIPQTLAGSFCYTGNILATVEGEKTCNSTSGCSWSNVTVYRDCPHGCEENITKFGADCIEVPYLLFAIAIIIIIIIFVGLGWLAKGD